MYLGVRHCGLCNLMDCLLQRPMCFMPRWKTCNDVWWREMVTRSMGYLRAGFSSVNSMKAHISKVHLFFKNDPSYHLFGVAESKLGPKVEDYLVRIDKTC